MADLTKDEIVAQVLERINSVTDAKSRWKHVRQKLALWLAFSVSLGCLGLIINCVVLLAESRFELDKAFVAPDVFLAAAIIAATATGDLVIAKVPDSQRGLEGFLIVICVMMSVLCSILYWVFHDPLNASANGWVTLSMFLMAAVCAALSVMLAAGR